MTKSSGRTCNQHCGVATFITPPATVQRARIALVRKRVHLHTVSHLMRTANYALRAAKNHTASKPTSLRILRSFQGPLARASFSSQTGSQHVATGSTYTSVTPKVSVTHTPKLL